MGLSLGNPICGTLGLLEAEGRTFCLRLVCTAEGKLYADLRGPHQDSPPPPRPLAIPSAMAAETGEGPIPGGGNPWRLHIGVQAQSRTERPGYGPDEGPLPEGKAGTRRGGVTDWSRMGSKRFAILTGC